MEGDLLGSPRVAAVAENNVGEHLTSNCVPEDEAFVAPDEREKNISNLAMAENLDDLDDSEPDYDYLVEEGEQNYFSSEEPIFYDNLGMDSENVEGLDDSPNHAMHSEEFEEFHYEVDHGDFGEEYIVGTLMVRILQARNLKSNPHHHGGGLSGLLFDHRRNRHRSAISPASGGNLTPSSHAHQQTYASISFREQTQRTTYALDPLHAPSSNGDFYWSRSDQSYFDVTCSSYPLKLAQMQQRPFRSKQSSVYSQSKDEVLCCKTSPTQQQKRAPRHLLPPILDLSVYSRNEGQGGAKKSMKKQTSPQDGCENDDYLLGKCAINVLQVLTGKNTYFDEWCILHDESGVDQSNQHREVGRVRVVIEYEPTDPPPRPGDLCVFANIFPLVKERHPIPSYSIQNSARPFTSMSSLGASSSSATLTSTSSNSIANRPTTALPAQPKYFRVEEVVGDHIVLSFQTPNEGWLCTFEIHRYLILCTHRHQAAVEKYREHVLDFCDNISQSPMVGTLAKKVEVLPDEGLVYIGAEAIGGGVSLLGRWFEKGVGSMVEDVVDSMNLDGRYSHLSDDESQAEDDDDAAKEDMNQSTTPIQGEKEAIPGMPCCPITGSPMVDPVVAADGHTYERNAIIRWFQTSKRSPLTGAVLAHLELVPNYSLLSNVCGQR